MRKNRRSKIAGACGISSGRLPKLARQNRQKKQKTRARKSNHKKSRAAGFCPRRPLSIEFAKRFAFTFRSRLQFGFTLVATANFPRSSLPVPAPCLPPGFTRATCLTPLTGNRVGRLPGFAARFYPRHSCRALPRSAHSPHPPHSPAVLPALPETDS
jgi:hypothetical protein